jgi:hypothetical protein
LLPNSQKHSLDLKMYSLFDVGSHLQKSIGVEKEGSRKHFYQLPYFPVYFKANMGVEQEMVFPEKGCLLFSGGRSS